MMADTFMDHVLDKTFELLYESSKPTTLFRFVDDLNEETAQQIFKTTNNKYP